MQEILVLSSAYARLTAPTDSGGGIGGGESQGNLTGGGYCNLFLAGHGAVLLGNQRFLAEIA